MSALNSVINIVKQHANMSSVKVKGLRKELKPFLDQYAVYLQLGPKEQEILRFLWKNKTQYYTHNDLAKSLNKRTKTISNQITSIRAQFNNMPIREIASNLKDFY